MATLPVMPKQNGIVPRDTPVMLEETTTATWLAIGLLAESLGDYERALASYDSALRHSPNNLEALIGLANIYRLRDVFFKAAELYVFDLYITITLGLFIYYNFCSLDTVYYVAFWFDSL